MSSSALTDPLHLSSPPVAISFVADPPAGVPHVAALEPAGCGWRRAAINADKTSASFGCVGNRVYTGAGETDAYFAIPGSKLKAVEDSLAIITRANEELEKFHRARMA